MVQREANGVPKRAKVVVHTSKNLDYSELYKLMNEHVDIAKSKLMSDGLIGYRKFKSRMPHEYSHHGSGWYVDQNNWNTRANNIEGVWRCIKSNINGCRHRVSAKHLQKYLDEQVFRFNYKDLGGAVAFDRVLELGVG